MKKRTETITETYEITIIRANGRQARQYCDRCAVTVPVFHLEQITTLRPEAADEIREHLQAGTMHMASGGETRGAICGNTFARVLKQLQTTEIDQPGDKRKTQR